MTVTARVAVLAPSVLVNIAFAVPAATPLALPAVSTVMIDVLLELHVPVLSVVFVGENVTDKAFVSPTFTETVAGEIDTLATFTLGWTGYPTLRCRPGKS